MAAIAPPILSGDDWFIPKPALEMPVSWQWAMLGVMSALALAVLGYAIMEWRRLKRPTPVAVVIGSALASVYEPLGDLFAHVTYHEIGQLRAFASFGFSIPLWIVPTYVIFFGLPVVALQRVIGRGTAMRDWLLLWVGAAVGALFFEVWLLQSGAIAYYGPNQPFQLFGFPVWMAAVNASTMLVVAAVVRAADISVIGKRTPLLIALLFPAILMGAHGGMSLPIGAAMNGLISHHLTDLAASLSIVLSLSFLWISWMLVAQPSFRDQVARRD